MRVSSSSSSSHVSLRLAVTLLGAASTGEAQGTSTAHRPHGWWQPGFNPSRIPKPMGCLPSFLRMSYLLPFCSSGGGREGPRGLGASAQGPVWHCVTHSVSQARPRLPGTRSPFVTEEMSLFALAPANCAHRLWLVFLVLPFFFFFFIKKMTAEVI